MATAGEGLTAALGRLVELVPEADCDAVAELTRRLTQGAFRVLVAGEAKRGKSTLINALVGRNVLPTGVVPLTAIATTLVYGDADEVEVGFADGQRQLRGLDALAELVTEDGNPHNRRQVHTVTVRLPAPLLAKGLELVDTPGTGSVYGHNTAQAASALDRMDAAVFVLTADPPISASEREFLHQVRAGAVALFCILNKIDYLTAEELAQAQAFTERVLAAELGHPTAVWPVSARQALAGRQAGDDAAVAGSGWAAFEEMFTGYLAEHQQADLVRSVAGRAAQLARSAADTAAATLAGLALSAQELEQRLGLFRQRLGEVDRQRFESAALARAEFDRLLAETNAQAAALPAQTAPALLREVRERVGRLEAPLRQVEQVGLTSAAELIQHVVEEWRRRRGAELDAAVATLDASLAARLDAQVAAVRQAAASLFALDLLPLPDRRRLTGSHHFWYAFDPDPGNLDALMAAVRTHLPGALGRRRVTRHLDEQTLILLDKQIGRARADFQDRLAETQRALLRELDRRFDEGAGRITEAVERARLLRTQRVEEINQVRVELQTRQAQAAAIADELDRYTSGRTQS